MILLTHFFFVSGANREQYAMSASTRRCITMTGKTINYKQPIHEEQFSVQYNFLYKAELFTVVV